MCPNGVVATTMPRDTRVLQVTFPFFLNMNGYLGVGFDAPLDDTSKDVTSAEETDLQSPADMLRDGPDVYELFSVMVHSGGAHGGHYYAFIKNLESKTWFKFNDSVVLAASIAQVKAAEGDGKSAANAYMLMYRYGKTATALVSSLCHPIKRYADGLMLPLMSHTHRNRPYLLLFTRLCGSKTKRRRSALRLRNLLLAPFMSPSGVALPRCECPC